MACATDRSLPVTFDERKGSNSSLPDYFDESLNSSSRNRGIMCRGSVGRWCPRAGRPGSGGAPESRRHRSGRTPRRGIPGSDDTPFEAVPCDMVDNRPFSGSSPSRGIDTIARGSKPRVRPIPSIGRIRRSHGVPPCGPEHAPGRVRITLLAVGRGPHAHLAADRAHPGDRRQLRLRVRRRRQGRPSRGRQR